MIEFFIQLADQSNNKLKKEQLQQLNNIMSSHLLIMKKVFKLIWDIEKSWQIDPLSIHTQLQSRMLNKGRSYPVYDDCSYLFSNNTSLDGIKIPLNVYYQHLQKSVALKNFDYKLEDEIIRFFIDYHVDIKKRKPSTGH